MQGSFNPEIGGSVVVVSYCTWVEFFQERNFLRVFVVKCERGLDFKTFFLGEPKQFVTAWYSVRT